MSEKKVYQLTPIINLYFAANITLFYEAASEIFTIQKPVFYYTVYIKIKLRVR